MNVYRSTLKILEKEIDVIKDSEVEESLEKLQDEELQDDNIDDQELIAVYSADPVLSSFFSKSEIRQAIALDLKEDLLNVYRNRRDYD